MKAKEKAIYLKFNKRNNEVFYRIKNNEIISISLKYGIRRNKSLQILNINDFEISDEITFNKIYSEFLSLYKI